MYFNIQPSPHIIRKASILIDDYKLPDDNIAIISSRCSNLSNSFLKETLRNDDIDECIRYEIEHRYKKSVTNATYKFPRQGSKSREKKSLERKIAEPQNSVIKMRRTSTHKRINTIIPSVSKITSSFISLKNPYKSNNPAVDRVKQTQKKQITKSFANSNTLSSLNVTLKRPTHVRNATDYLINQRINYSKSPSHAKSTKVSPTRNKPDFSLILRGASNKTLKNAVKIHRSSKSKELNINKTLMQHRSKKSETTLPLINAIL